MLFAFYRGPAYTRGAPSHTVPSPLRGSGYAPGFNIRSRTKAPRVAFRDNVACGPVRCMSVIQTYTYMYI